MRSLSQKRIFKLKIRTILIGLVCSLVSIGFLLPASRAHAFTCTDNGLGCDIGYFSLQNIGGGTHHNLYKGNDFSWGGAPTLLGLRANNVGELTGLIGSRLACVNNAIPPATWVANPTAQNATAAAFTVLTMLGEPPGTSKDVACLRFWEWVNYMNQYDALGLIHYDEWHNLDGVNTRLSFSANTDVSYYSDWGPPTSTSIVIYAPDGSGPLYAIKRDCGNPIGHLRALQRLAYNVQPNVTVAPSSVEPGQSVTFTMSASTFGSQSTSGPLACTVYVIQRSGYVTNPAPIPGDPSHPVACGPYPPNISVTLETSTVNNAQPNTTYCRYLVIQNANQNGGTNQIGACAQVVSKPYAKVFGGDVSAGSSFGAACAQDPAAAMVGWNKRVAGAGAGVQYAGLTLNALQDFASAQVNVGNATPPTGLSFSNKSTNAAAGLFGTSFGASLPCLPDYFSQKPASAASLVSPIVNLGALASGAYSATGSVAINGTSLTSGKRIVLYVDGDVFIGGDIIYSGSWDPATAPLLKLVVRGNIFIAGGVGGTGVGRLDGLYIAQPTAAGAKGTIYTCTDPAPAARFTPLSISNLPNPPGNGIYNMCSKKLIINGSFSARHVELLRTAGTLAQSGPGDTPAANFAAEVFNYSPAFWLAQPPNGTSTDTNNDTYDSIVSLPPVL